jgi:glycosyltransferase involved in cell wall biosynthesis
MSRYGKQQFPNVAVITPSYNQARFLRQTIESVIHQDYPHIEYLIFDGGSTDGSVEIIRQYADRLAYWVSERDNGQADAINRGWQRSRGDILAWINSDDTYEPGAISAVVEVFRRHPEVDMVTGDCQVIDETGRVLHSLPSGAFDIHALLAGNSLPQQGVFCRRRAVEAVGWLDADLHYVFDWALWLKLWLNGARFYHLPCILANFRIWEQSKTASDTIGTSLSGGLYFAKERLSVLTRLLKAPEVAGHMERRRLFRTALLGNLLELALLHQLANETQQMDDYLDRFVEASPASLQAMPYPQALAAHLAYLHGNPDQAIDRFLDVLSGSMARSGRSLGIAAWKRVLRAETYLVQAWHATHLSDNRRAARCFTRAMVANPVLLFQRRALSPTIKSLLRLTLAGQSRHSLVDNSYNSE